MVRGSLVAGAIAAASLFSFSARADFVDDWLALKYPGQVLPVSAGDSYNLKFSHPANPTSLVGPWWEKNAELLGKLTIPHFEKLSGELHLAVRPEKLRISNEILPSSHFSFPGEVDAVVYHGSESHVYLKTDAGPLLCATLTNLSRNSVRPKKGERLWIGWAPEDTLVLLE